MAITIPQRVVYPNTVMGDSGAAIITVAPTTPNSTIIIAAAYNDNGGATILSVIDNAGDLFDTMDASSSVLPENGPGGSVDLWWCQSGTGERQKSPWSPLHFILFGFMR